MIVPQPIARKLVNGQATQVRLPANSPRCPHRVGKDYCVKPLRVETVTVESSDSTADYDIRDVLPEVGRIVIVDVHRTHLADLTLEDANREGFRTRDDHREAWARFRGTWRPDMPVWVLTVKPHTDPVRIIAPTGSQAGRITVTGELAGAEHDYTSSTSRLAGTSMQGEPEAVDDATLARFATDARAVHGVGELERLKARLATVRSQEERAALLRRVAREKGLDIRDHERGIDKRLDAIQRIVEQHIEERAA